MKDIIIRITGLVLLLVTNVGLAQSEVEMADTMRTEGKIYVIVAIVLIVLAGLVVYLFMLDRKVKNLENRIK
ncbi:MAG: CcmD family protein [Cyclobacteriaceae bacterium]|nr:CcmD family protein [Cyclobacteriaceae bacterium]UYN86678.1 MAG: CcmD family protein [Cyclobacteriaceae bacterium]